jgi:outer membrane protein assembly factor BamE (lipoprotein component of BamABCDE complex)
MANHTHYRVQAMLRQSSFAFFLIAALGAACAPIVDQRGNLPSEEQLVQIVPGNTKRDDVLAILGTPSSATKYDDEAWYYISGRTETKAFLKPAEVERKVIIVKFDKKGMVTDINTLGLEDGKEFKKVERVTPTSGSEMTFLEQIFGNIGRFGDPKMGR